MGGVKIGLGDQVNIKVGDEKGGWGIVTLISGGEYHVAMYGPSGDSRVFERGEISKSRRTSSSTTDAPGRGSASQPLRFGTRPWARDVSDYEGVLRRGRAVVWGCGHHHHNRDLSTGVNGVAARPCIETRLDAVRSEHVAKEWRSNMRGNAARAARLLSAGNADHMRYLDNAENAIKAFDQQLAELASVIGDEPVFGPGTSLVAPPAPVIPCAACGVDLSPATCVRPSGYGQEFTIVWTNWGPVRASIYDKRPDCVGGVYYHPDPTRPVRA